MLPPPSRSFSLLLRLSWDLPGSLECVLLVPSFLQHLAGTGPPAQPPDPAHMGRIQAWAPGVLVPQMPW